MALTVASLSENCIATMLATDNYVVNAKQSTQLARGKKLSRLAMVSPFATWEQRIAWLRKYRGYPSNRALAEACGVSYATINNLLKRERDTGEARLDPRTSLKVASTTNVDHMWLITGDGLPDTRVSVEADGLEVRKANDARRRAAAELSRLDGIDEKEAAFVLQSIDLPPDQATEPMAYYAAARIKLGTPDTLGRGRLAAERKQLAQATESRDAHRSHKR